MSYTQPNSSRNYPYPSHEGFLRCFHSIALRIPIAHDFRVISACTYTTKELRNYPQAKLDNEINARFVLNGHGGLYFLLHNN